MNDSEAIKLIQERIGEIVSNPQIQEKLIGMKQKGHTEQECLDMVQKMAIATLFGL